MKNPKVIHLKDAFASVGSCSELVIEATTKNGTAYRLVFSGLGHSEATCAISHLAEIAAQSIRRERLSHVWARNDARRAAAKINSELESDQR